MWGHTTKTKPPRVVEPWTRKLEGPAGSSTVSTTSAGPPAAVGPPGSSSHTSTSTKSLRREVGRGLQGGDGGSAPGQGSSPGLLSAAITPPPPAPVAPALLRQHGAASLSHRHPVGARGAAAGVRVQVGAEGHATERHPCPALQRGTPGVELRKRQPRHPEPQKPGDGHRSGKLLPWGARHLSWRWGLWMEQGSHHVPPHMSPPSPSKCLGDVGCRGDGGADLRR